MVLKKMWVVYYWPEKSGALSWVFLSLPSLFPLICSLFLISFYSECRLDRAYNGARCSRRFYPAGECFVYYRMKTTFLPSLSFWGCLCAKPKFPLSLWFTFRCQESAQTDISFCRLLFGSLENLSD